MVGVFCPSMLGLGIYYVIESKYNACIIHLYCVLQLDKYLDGNCSKTDMRVIFFANEFFLNVIAGKCSR